MDGVRPDKLAAKAEGIPSWLRRYANRYGKDVYTTILIRRRHK